MKKIVCFLMILLSSKAICQEIEWVVKPTYELDSVRDFNNGYSTVRLKATKKWGLVDRSGKFIIQPIYDRTYVFSRGWALVKIGHKFNFINKDEQKISEQDFDSVESFKEQGGLAVVRIKGKNCLLYVNGKLMETEFDEISSFSEGLALVAKNGKYNHDYEYMPQKFGFIDKDGKVVIDLKYDSATPFKGGSAIVGVDSKRDFLSRDIFRKLGYIDKSGKEIIKPQFDYKISTFVEDFAEVEFKPGKWNFINSRGEKINNKLYKRVYNFSEGLGAVLLSEKKWNFIDRNGKEITKTYYERVYNFQNGLATVKKHGKWGSIDKTGNEVIQPIYDEPIFFYGEHLAWVKNNDNYKLINNSGKILFSREFSEVKEFSENLSAIRKFDKWEYVDANGYTIIESIFDEANSFSEGLAWVKQNGKWGIIKNPLTNSSKPYEIIWLNPKARQKTVASTKVNDKNFKIEAVISSNLSEEQIKKNTNIIINGVSQKGIRLGNPATRASSQNSFFFEQAVELNEGKNLIKIVTTLPNGKIIESSTAEIFYSTKPANLFLYSFGVQSDLRFTANDARSIYELFRTQVGKTFDKVYALPPFISYEATTASSIRKNLESLSKRKDINKEDVVIVFISSHGNEDDDGNFRLQGSDWNSTSPTESSVSFKNHIIGYLDKLNCKKIILIDACHSGNGTKEVPADINKAIADAPPGTIIITSSTGVETSVEHPSWQNGAFTKAIIEALRDKKAKYDKDNILYIPALFAYIEKRVPEIVQSVPEFNSKNQSPQIKNSQNLPIYWAK